jgi:hypothetical protein
MRTIAMNVEALQDVLMVSSRLRKHKQLRWDTDLARFVIRQSEKPAPGVVVYLQFISYLHGMKRLILLSYFVALLTYETSAQDHKPLIKHTAELLGDATVRKDYSAVADYTYPKFIEAVGGRDSLLSAIKQQFDKLKSQGSELIIRSVTIGEPGDEALINSVLYSVVPEAVVLEVKGVKYSITGSLIAISSDRGQHWSFLDTEGLENLKQLFPDIRQITIPPSTDLVRLKDN